MSVFMFHHGGSLQPQARPSQLQHAPSHHFTGRTGAVRDQPRTDLHDLPDPASLSSEGATTLSTLEGARRKRMKTQSLAWFGPNRWWSWSEKWQNSQD